ncbi:TRAP transporter small permease [Aquisalimonas lutea]|uniref:TRAP transporter small permease n=1 Tax=Aquisalimonas lutea TaxID=1327750 RepID=UPI0025B4B3A6|nr:TRAP transporter small permease [Aquisalimonas lutea]MDN3519774.1 TRAP transporter small permease [Aquisalimonas lutea]
MRSAYRLVGLFLLWIDRALMLIVGVCLLAIMGIIVADVVFRYALDSPLQFSTHLITYYLFPITVFFALSHTFERNENVQIDFFAQFFPRWLGLAVNFSASLFISLVFFTISYKFYERTINSLVNADTVYGVIQWLTWPTWGLVTVGFFFLGARVLYRLLGSFLGEDEIFSVEQMNKVPEGGE